MQHLITWPTYGNWFAGRGRGGFAIDPSTVGDALAEPTLCGEAVGQQPSRWPAVQLDADQRRVVLDDLQRVADLRAFTIDTVVVGPTFVQVLIDAADSRDVGRLVQLSKGATARALTVAAGDQLPVDANGAPLPHHKWWSRQYAHMPVTDGPQRRDIVALLTRRAATPDCDLRRADTAG